jgi:uncharacterized protein YjbI with pentapeptide repeats
LNDTDLSHANLNGAYLNGAYLIDANLTGANLTNLCYDKTTQWSEGFTPPPAVCILALPPE